MGDFEGKRIWLTGASLGIGRALAIELAARGARLVLTSRSPEPLAALAAELGGPERAIALSGDVTDAKRMHDVAATASDELGGIDILVANAGTHLFTKPEAFDAEEYLRLMSINYGGMLHAIEAVLPAMLERGSGHIVGVASLAGFRGMPRAAAYCASKSAMIAFLESLRFHTKSAGVPVTIVNPGFVRTPLTDKNDFHMPFLVEPDRAARIMADGIARQKKEIAFPFPFSTTMRLMRVLPYPIYEWLMNRTWQRMNNS